MTAVLLVLTIALAGAAAVGLSMIARDSRRARAADARDQVLHRFRDLRITPDLLLVGPAEEARAAGLPGLRATVLTGDQIAARAATGQHVPRLDEPTNPRTVYLIVEGREFTVVREVPLRSRVTDIAAAYRFANALNLRATTLEDELRMARHSTAE